MDRRLNGEIEDAMRSDRFFRIVSVSAHVYSLMDSSQEWKELSPCPVPVHLYNDAVENCAKLIAIHKMELVIAECPLLQYFSVHSPSKKFLHIVCNKNDKNSDVYGFGFADSRELDTLYLHLRRLKMSFSPAYPYPTSLPSTPRRNSFRYPKLSPSFFTGATVPVTPFSPGPCYKPVNYYKDSPYSSPLHNSIRAAMASHESESNMHSSASTNDFLPYFSYADGGDYGVETAPAATFECDLEADSKATIDFQRPSDEAISTSTPITSPPRFIASYSELDEDKEDGPINKDERDGAEGGAGANLLADDMLFAHRLSMLSACDLAADVETAFNSLVESFAPLSMDEDKPFDPETERPENPAGVIGTPVKGVGGKPSPASTSS